MHNFYFPKPQMHQHINMHHLQGQVNTAIPSPQSPPGNRWMTNMVGNNGKFQTI